MPKPTPLIGAPLASNRRIRPVRLLNERSASPQSDPATTKPTPAACRRSVRRSRTWAEVSIEESDPS